MSIPVKDSYVLVAGFAQLPKGTPIYEIQKMIGCVLIIDKDTETIIDASFTFLMSITNDFISSFFRGKSVGNGIEPLLEEVETKFLVPPQRAVIQSIRFAYERYLEIKGE
ncbi:DUF3870 domain-containing protein [Brevibacillus daliensis]|uniref:DUF3870 domain-containing protein n=1 Tax=Brevibacillus daliensis TaxID=2892995 RepID=UPI001E3D1563|nr:DUF3870 domain-containing protein [Brevibacillus daliensis]